MLPPEEYVAVVTGGRSENTCLLREHFDYIFFTGSQGVGKEVMRNAAQHLTPVTLELGGQSPCIVEKSANLKLAARRIVFGQFLNCGQTCVAPDYIYCDASIKEELLAELKKEVVRQFTDHPDYIYCDASIKEELLAELKKEVVRQFTDHPLSNDSYGKIINQKHFSRILELIDPEKVVHGGNAQPELLKIEPTLMDSVTFSDPVMQEDIFGPVLPLLPSSSLDSAIETINSMAHPLALYIFTSDKKAAKKVTSRCGFGGGCINLFFSGQCH